jgi:hypothetical protein
LLTDVPLVAIATDSVDPHVLSRPSVSKACQLLSTATVLGSLTAVAELLFSLMVHNEPPARQPDRPLPVPVLHPADRHLLRAEP